MVCLGLLLAASTPSLASGDQPAFSSRALSPEPGWGATSGARAATESGPASGWGNPAAAAGGEGFVWGFSHLAWAGEVSREWTGAVIPIGVVSIGLDAALLHGPELPGYDPLGVPTGTIRPSEWCAGLSLAASPHRMFSGGLGVRYFRLDDPATPLGAVGVSLGAVVGSGGRRLGAAVTDLGPAAQVDGASYPLPTAWRIGLEQAVRDGRGLLAVALEGNRATDLVARIGLAIRPIPWMELLGGARIEDVETEAGPWSAGARFRQGRFTIAYGWQSVGTLGQGHQIGLGLDFSGPSTD